MKATTLVAVAVCALCAASACARQDDDAKALRETLRQQLHFSGRALRANAYSSASGSNTAMASATATPTQATTSQSASGGPAQVTGISQVGNKVDVCQRGPANSAACQTLTTADRSSGCTDIAPGTDFTCQEQAFFNKCNADFIFKGAYCLKSCKRCGAACTDTAPSGMTCDASQCNSDAMTAGPYCLKTCNRCSTAS